MPYGGKCVIFIMLVYYIDCLALFDLRIERKCQFFSSLRWRKYMLEDYLQLMIEN